SFMMFVVLGSEEDRDSAHAIEPDREVRSLLLLQQPKLLFEVADLRFLRPLAEMSVFVVVRIVVAVVHGDLLLCWVGLGKRKSPRHREVAGAFAVDRSCLRYERKRKAYSSRPVVKASLLA